MEPTKANQGQRKVKHARETSVILLCGFIFAVLCKAPAELFVSFAGGLCAISGAFVYGNAKEHAAQAADQTPNQTKP